MAMAFLELKESCCFFGVDGGVYLITGENEVGKSTLLNAIASLLTGDRTANNLKHGEEKGFAKMKVSDEKQSYEVELKFTEKNPRGNLKITTSTGFSSDNKSMIQKLFGYSDFDANEFVGWSNTAEAQGAESYATKTYQSRYAPQTNNGYFSASWCGLWCNRVA